MSAAVNDRPHDVFSSRPHLPLTGEIHPLRREFERLLATGNAIALTFAMLACTVIYFWPREAVPISIPAPPTSDIGIFPSPPPIVPTGGGGGEQLAVATDVHDAVIEPVHDEELVPAPTAEPEIDGPGEPGPGGPITELPPSDGTPLLVEPKSPAPDEFVPFDSAPVLLSYEPPAYPSIVREAGIDGTVNVRVLVGVNGKVKSAYVVDGPPALHNAALASARTALFKAALQGVHPVEAWVVMPITFQLSTGR
jgi:protein TonB